MTSRMMGFVFLSLLFSSASSGQDKSKYYTVQHADEFSIDWISFYEVCDQRTEKARKELPHHLDLAYGDNPKQKLDLYLPKEKTGGRSYVLVPSRGRHARRRSCALRLYRDAVRGKRGYHRGCQLPTHGSGISLPGSAGRCRGCGSLDSPEH